MEVEDHAYYPHLLMQLLTPIAQMSSSMLPIQNSIIIGKTKEVALLDQHTILMDAIAWAAVPSLIGQKEYALEVI